MKKSSSKRASYLKGEGGSVSYAEDDKSPNNGLRLKRRLKKSNSVRREGVTAFYLSAKTGQVGMLKLLKANCAEIDVNEICDKSQSTALHAAASRDHLDAVEFLIEQGCDTEKVNKNKETPLVMATISGS